MLRQGLGAEERRWTHLLCLQCPVSGKSQQILVWRNVKVLCLTFCSPKTWCDPSLDSPNGIGCQRWLFYLFFPFVSQIIYDKAPAFHCFWSSAIYANGFYPALMLIYLLHRFQVAMTANWNVMLAFHLRLAWSDRRLHGRTNSWFHSRSCWRLEVRKKHGVCVMIWLTLHAVPVHVVGEVRMDGEWDPV